MKIYLIGMPLSGKSLIGKLLSIKLNYRFIDTDEELKKIGVSFNFNKKNEQEFRELETTIYQKDFGDNIVIATGGGIVTREENFNSVSGLVVFLNPTIYELNFRNLKYKHPIYSLYSVKTLFKRRYPIYQKYANLVINTNGRDALDIVKEIYEKVKKNISN